MPRDTARAVPCPPGFALADVPGFAPSYPVPAVIAQPRRIFVERGLVLRGELSGCDHLRIAGHIESDVTLRLLDILDEGSFKGRVAADKAFIAGRYEGALTVAETLFVGPAAHISGSVECGKLELIDGGKINGELRILAEETLAADADDDAPPLLSAAPGSETDQSPARDATTGTPPATPDFDEAETMFKSVLDRHPENLGALAGLGHLARRRGDREAMHRYYAAALALEPKNIQLRIEVARAFKEQGDVALARHILETVLSEH